MSGPQPEVAVGSEDVAAEVPAPAVNGEASTEEGKAEVAPQDAEPASEDAPAPAAGAEPDEEQPAAEAADEDEHDEAADVDKAEADEEVKQPRTVELGFKTFTSKKGAADYFHHIIGNMPKDTDLNEYEFRAVFDLLQKGHHSASAKIGAGVRAIQVREYFSGSRDDKPTKCFFLVRKDGSSEDFSLLKCLTGLFGEDAGGGHGGRHKSHRQHGGRAGPPHKRPKYGHGGGNRGGFRGRGRGRGRGRF